jgi:AhpD family alkylhydroperoxidase
MKNPAMIIPDAMQAILALDKSANNGPVPSTTLELVHLRASQINGCSSCVDGGSRHAKQARETDERLFAVAAWREAPYFTDGERAALALTEAVTRLSDRADPVPDEIWDEAGRPALRRAGARGLDPRDRDDQRVQPPQCHHQASRGSLGLSDARAARSPRRPIRQLAGDTDGHRLRPVDRCAVRGRASATSAHAADRELFDPHRPAALCGAAAR